MSGPVQRDSEALKRLTRCLCQRRCLVVCFCWQPAPLAIEGYGDSRCTRRSTSGGALMGGVHTIKAWSVTQATVPRSLSLSHMWRRSA